MTESPEVRLKQLKMRSMRRGIKEMDVILGVFADTGLAALAAADLRTYEALLEENDHDLYQWVSGQAAPPKPFARLIGLIAKTTAKG